MTVVPIGRRAGADHAEPPVTFTVPELAAYLRLSLGSTYQYLQAGDIPARRSGRRWIISRRRIDAWLDESGDLDDTGSQSRARKES